MASHCVPDVLEMEVSKARPTATARVPPRTDSGDGPRQSDLGRGTGCCRTDAQAEHSSLTTDSRVLYVFVAMEINSRRILHCNVTAHPTAEWNDPSSSGRSLRNCIHTGSSFTIAIRSFAFARFD